MEDRFYVEYNPGGDFDVDDSEEVTQYLYHVIGKPYIQKEPPSSLICSSPTLRPSIIARSDAELYDSDVRWAKRAHIFRHSDTNTYLGFANIRALNLFLQRLPDANRRVFLDFIQRFGQHTINVICEAFLVPPQQYSDEGFVFPVASDLAMYHNEFSGWNSTAYASPGHVWGGLCSQACVHMAMYPMIRFGCKVLGISDITAASFAKDRGRKIDLEIKGLTLSQIWNILRDPIVGISAFWERIPFTVEHNATTSTASFLLATYLSQGFPLIVSVKGRAIVAENRDYYQDGAIRFATKDQAKIYGYKDNLHTILIVGYKKFPNGKYEFIYHDSIGAIYGRISAERLAQVAADQFSQDDPKVFDVIVPVPKYVKVPLGGSDIGELDTKAKLIKNNKIVSTNMPAKVVNLDFGILNSSKAIYRRIVDAKFSHDIPRSFRGFFPFEKTHTDKSYTIVRTKDIYDLYISLNVENTEQAGDEWARLRAKLPSTFWIEEFSQLPLGADPRIAARSIGGFWGWSCDNPCYDDGFVCQVPLLQAMGGKLQVDHGSFCQGVIKLKDEHKIDVRKNRLLEIGVISSFAADTLVNNLQILAKNRIENIDLFVFQDKDIHPYFGVDADKPLLSILQNFDIDDVAGKIAKDLDQADIPNGYNFNIRGLATYVPAISSCDDTQRDNAVRALSNMIQLAPRLRTQRNFRNLHYVEIVAGTVLANPSSSASGAKFDAMAFSDKIELLIKSLYKLSKVAEEADVFLSIEIEPGSLPIINSYSYLQQFVERLTSGPCEYIHRIGINIDVCHMWLCQISPSEIMRNKDIRKRITHVHIGDIGPGHIGDLVTGVNHDCQEYYGWFDLFNSLANDLPRKGYPDFSCCLSVELEACRKPDMISSAYHRSKLLLDRYYDWRQMSEAREES